MRLTGVAPVGASLQSIGPTVKLGGNIVGGVIEVVMQGYVELVGIQQVALSTCFTFLSTADLSDLTVVLYVFCSGLLPKLPTRAWTCE